MPCQGAEHVGQERDGCAQRSGSHVPALRTGRGDRKGTNGVGTNGATAKFMCVLTEGLFGYSR